MAISEAFAGTETMGASQISLTTDTAGPDVETSDGVFQLFLDLSGMGAADELLIRGYEKVQSGDTQRIFLQATLMGPQSPPIFVTPAFVLLHGWDFTLAMPAGAAVITWSIRKAS